MLNWFEKTAQAIQKDPALKIFAPILALLHVLTGASWLTYNYMIQLQERGGVCWPFFPQCNQVRAAITPRGLYITMLVYMVIAGLAAGLFALSRIRAGLAALGLATILEVAFHLLEYRAKSNEAYMLNWILLAFFFAPKNKVQVIQALIGTFYFWAGLLKSNTEWVSGAALYTKPFLVPDALIPASCVYVLVLEVIMVWGLYAKSAKVRWLVLAQFILFHAVSWRVVGYHYPLLMWGILAIFPLAWLLTPGKELTRGTLLAGSPMTIATMLVVFSLLQIPGHLLFPGDTVLTGEGRIFALNMFDTRAVCKGAATAHGAAGQTMNIDLVDVRLKTRMRCDPLVAFSRAAQLCEATATQPAIASIDVLFEARRIQDPTFHPVIQVSDFCKQGLSYSLFQHNPWLLPAR